VRCGENSLYPPFFVNAFDKLRVRSSVRQMKFEPGAQLLGTDKQPVAGMSVSDESRL
jgi:hypothetical protein